MYCTTKQAAEILHRRKENCKLIYCTAQRMAYSTRAGRRRGWYPC